MFSFASFFGFPPGSYLFLLLVHTWHTPVDTTRVHACLSSVLRLLPKGPGARNHWRRAIQPTRFPSSWVLRGSLILIFIYVLGDSPILEGQALPTSALLPCYPIGDNELPAQSRSPLTFRGFREDKQLPSRPQDVSPTSPKTSSYPYTSRGPDQNQKLGHPIGFFFMCFCGGWYLWLEGTWGVDSFKWFFLFWVFNFLG